MNSSNTSKPTSWHILGAGAIGCLWASHLSRVGHRVTLLLRANSDSAKSAESQAVLLESEGVVSSTIVRTERCTEENSPIHRVLVCTKSFDALAAILSIKHRLTTSSQIVLLINGLGVQQECVKRCPGTTIICGSSSDGAYRRDTFHVVQAGKGQTYFGAINPSAVAETNRIRENFMASLKGIGLTAHWSDDILQQLWRKLAVNCAINPLTAIHRCRNGELLNDPRRVSCMREVCTEIATILSALRLPYSEPPLFELASYVAQSTAQNYSSMYQDVSNARPTEIDQINGYICQLANQLSLPAPTNEWLYRRVKNYSTIG